MVRPGHLAERHAVQQARLRPYRPGRDAFDASARPLSAAPAPARTAGGVAETVSADGVRELFSHVQVRPGADGKVIFEAPAQAATILAAPFEGMARMLCDASTPPAPAG